MAGSVPTVQRATAPAPPDRDAEARAWIGALRAGGAEREEAARRLHGMLLRAARFEVSRRRAMLAGSSRETIDDLAMQSADDALSAILAKLDDYRFESRFTTWAYKFAILEAAVRTRRRAWQERELPIAPPTPGPHCPRGRCDRAEDLEGRERLRAHHRGGPHRALAPSARGAGRAGARRGSRSTCSPNGWGTTRGALYKTLHDARRKLRTVIGADS